MNLTRKRGDTRPIDATLTRAGKAVPLDGCMVMFFMDPIEPARGTVVQADAQVTDPVKGRVRYSPVSDDVSREGLHRAEFQVLFPDGVLETFPNGEGGDDYLYVEIIENLASFDRHGAQLGDTGAAIDDSSLSVS